MKNPTAEKRYTTHLAPVQRKFVRAMQKLDIEVWISDSRKRFGVRVVSDELDLVDDIALQCGMEF